MGRGLLPPSHHKLGHLVTGEVQREVLAGSLDGEGVLVATDAAALIGEALVTAAVAMLLGAAEGVAVRRVLAELRPLQAVLLVQAHVIQGLAVPVG